MPTMSGAAIEPSLQALSDFAETLADEVRPLSLGWFRRRLEIDLKADESPVTIADRNVEQALRRRIAERFPTHGILGEEFGSAHADAEFVWSIDPIDGTRSFITGFPLWGTLLAVLHRGSPVVGVIDMPVQAERWVGRYRQGAWLNGAACTTSKITRLSDATVYATSPDIFQGAEADAFARLSGAVRSRRFGGDCYAYALLASGHIDLVMEASLQPYDYLALAPVIEAAGGVITDWDGQPLTLHSRGRVIAAANAALHREALAVIGSVAS